MLGPAKVAPTLRDSAVGAPGERAGLFARAMLISCQTESGSAFLEGATVAPSRARPKLAVLCGAAGLLLIFSAVLIGYTRRSLFDERAFADRISGKLYIGRLANGVMLRPAGPAPFRNRFRQARQYWCGTCTTT